VYSNCCKQDTSRHAFLGVLCSSRYAQLLTTIFVTLFGAQPARRICRRSQQYIQHFFSVWIDQMCTRKWSDAQAYILSSFYLMLFVYVPKRRASCLTASLFSSGFTVRVCRCCTSWPRSSCFCSLSAELKCPDQCQKGFDSELSEKQ